MDAASLVALARKGAGRVIHAVEDDPPEADEHAYVFPNGGVLMSGPSSDVHPSVTSDASLSAPLTAENLASNAAMERALLRSRITVEFDEAEYGNDPTGSGWIAWVNGKSPFSAELMRGGSTEAEAVEALLDALLGEVTA